MTELPISKHSTPGKVAEMQLRTTKDQLLLMRMIKFADRCMVDESCCMYRRLLSQYSYVWNQAMQILGW